MKEDKIANLSIDFALDIINLVKTLSDKNETIISRQIGRSGTSIGANISEAKYAQSKADFISKLQIALKEANETSYWLELLIKSNSIKQELYNSLNARLVSLKAIIITSINTAKHNAPVNK